MAKDFDFASNRKEDRGVDLDFRGGIYMRIIRINVIGPRLVDSADCGRAGTLLLAICNGNSLNAQTHR